MIFYYVRHGDPIYSPDSLTAFGKRQAEALSKRFACHGLDRIFSSPSIRAKQTAAPTCAILKKEKIVLDWCSEDLARREFAVEYEKGKDRWCFHHKPTIDIFASVEIRELGKEFYGHDAFSNEAIYGISDFKNGLDRIGRAADEFFAELGYLHDEEKGGYIVKEPSEERIALFAHQGFGLAFLSCILDIPYPMFCTRFDFGHSGVTAIEFSGKKGELCVPIVLQLSNDSHLYKEELGTNYQNRIYI